jgi:low temperature requirement protein LtrA
VFRGRECASDHHRNRNSSTVHRVTDPAAQSMAPTQEPEHRASWLELFFDLVVVVAIATLTERLTEDAGGWALAKVLIMYLAVWLVWTSFMLYANIAADKTHRRAMLIAMGCIAIMAAAVPEIEDRQRGTVFAITYIVARVIASGTWRNTGRVLVEWPIAQLSVGLVPWTVSIWMHDPVRYYLWALGLALDIGFALWSRDGTSMLELFQRKYDQRIDQQQRRSARRTQSGRSEREGRTRNGRIRNGQEQPTEFTAAEVNPDHFGERLGTFTIIVLGEAVSQIVMAASRVEWNRHFELAAVASFLLLFGLWWLTFQYSSYTEKDSKADVLPPHLALPLHFLSTTAIMLMAAGLGGIVGHPEEPMGTGQRWLLGGGMAAYLLFTQAALAFTRWQRPWWLGLIGFVLICAPVLLSGFGAELEDWMLGIGFALVIGAQVLFRRLDVRAAAGAASD